MDKEALGRLLLETAYLEGDFVLRSGKKSKYYLDKYLFETEPQVLRGIVHEMAMMVRNQLASGAEYQRLAAPELGGVVLGAGLSLELGHPPRARAQAVEGVRDGQADRGASEGRRVRGAGRGHRHLGGSGHLRGGGS